MSRDLIPVASGPVPRALDTGQIQRSLVVFGYLVVSAVAIVFSHWGGETSLGDANTDGYTSQVVYIWNYFDGRNSIFDLEPLLWIHALRALIAWVFVSVEDVGGSGLVAAILIMLTLPVLSAFYRLRRGWLVIALPIVSMIISERAFLVVIAVAYMMIFIRGGGATFFLGLSFILSNLSSGSVMNNLIISSTVARNYRPKSFGLYLYIAVQSVSLVISAIDKYRGFSEQRAGYDATVYGASGVEAILSRSTIFVSLMEGNYTRLLAYLVLGAIGAGLLAFAVRVEQYRGYVLVLASIVPSLIFEGLGFMSLLVPILLFLAGEPLPWKPGGRRG